MLEEKERFGGAIASKKFFRRARTHARVHVLVRREDPPTHSCWRSVVDDNGNPIFRNNICLEDRRLTSCDADVYTRARTRVCVRAQHEVFHSRRDVSHSICSSVPRRFLGNRIEKNSNRREGEP